MSYNEAERIEIPSNSQMIKEISGIWDDNDYIIFGDSMDKSNYPIEKKFAFNNLVDEFLDQILKT